MRRRSRASSKPAKAGSHKAKTLKAARRRSSSIAGQETEVVRLTRELNTITEQQRATTDVLKLISSSFGDPQPVFASILASAVRLCDADNGIIRRGDGDALHLVATHNIPQAFIQVREQSPYRPLQYSPSGRCWRPESSFTSPI